MADSVIRASDDDRERVVGVLREHTAQGRLTLDEFEERMTAAYAAKTWDDLRQLTRDLPAQVDFGSENAECAGPDRSDDRTRTHGGLAIPRMVYLVPLLAVVALLAVPVAAGAVRVIPFPLLFIGLFWFFCGRGCGSRSRRSDER